MIVVKRRLCPVGVPERVGLFQRQEALIEGRRGYAGGSRKETGPGSQMGLSLGNYSPLGTSSSIGLARNFIQVFCVILNGKIQMDVFISPYKMLMGVNT